MASDRFTTCLWFDGRAEEAAQHYVSIFKDGKIGRTVRYPEPSPGTPGSVLTVDFEVNGQKFVGLNGGPEFTFNEAISFQIHCADQDEVDHYWNRLLEGGGQEIQCGWVKDKFGVSWQVIPAVMDEMIADSDPAKAKRVFDAMMKMVKLDVAALQRAYAGE